MNKIKLAGFLVLALGCSYIGWQGYHYFLDDEAPEVWVKGLDDGGHYAGDMVCSIAGHDGYKVSTVSVWLDGKPLIDKFKINAREFDHPFTIPTHTLPQGKHLLKVQAMNGTYRQRITTKEHEFFVDNEPLHAAFVKPETEHKVFQGRTLHLQLQSSKPLKHAMVKAFSAEFPCFPESKHSTVYEAFIPVACETNPNEYMVSVELKDHVGNVSSLDAKCNVVAYPFKKQVLKVDNDKFQKEREQSIDGDAFEQQVAELSKKSPQEKLWQGAFYAPTEVNGISTEFGTVRTTQQKGKYAHKGVDVLNMPKSVIWAPQYGVVVMKGRYEFSGNTVVIDHGHGILSLFFHLDDFANIQVGQKVSKGNPIGTLGKTGYASGYHLHWEMRVNNVHVDPMQWINQHF